MVRRATKLNPLSRSPIVFTNSNPFVSVNSNMSTGFVSGISMTSGTASSTNTLTLVSLQGPGMINFLDARVSHDIGGSSPMLFNLYVDGVTCYSATHTCIGTTTGYWNSCMLIGKRRDNETISFMPIPFRYSVVATIKGPYAGFTAGVNTHWRLTNG